MILLFISIFIFKGEKSLLELEEIFLFWFNILIYFYLNLFKAYILK